jgi:hypothetical protein
LAPAVDVVPTAPPLSAHAPAVCCSATCAAVAPAAACCAIASDAGSPAAAPYAQRTKTGCARSASVAVADAVADTERPRPKETLTPAAALQLAFSGQTSLAPPSAESAAGWAWPLAKASTSVTAQPSRPTHEVAPAAFGATKA